MGVDLTYRFFQIYRRIGALITNNLNKTLNNMLDKNNEIYTSANIPLFETIYGKDLISLGGIAAIDNMFSDIELSKLKVLDLGFGLGGVAFYLAEKYKIEIAGVELHEWMVDHAQKSAPKELSELLHFTTYKAGKIPFTTDSFDIVYSKGVLNHVRDKFPLFQDIYGVLKNGGEFIIADWISPKADPANLENPLVNETKMSYRMTLEKAGFKAITFRDDSLIFTEYVQNFIKQLMSQRESFISSFGEDIFESVLQNHENLLDNIAQKQKFAVRITAKKI